MKLLKMYVSFVMLFLLAIMTGRGEDLPAQGQAVRDEINKLIELSNLYPATYVNNVNTLQERLETIRTVEKFEVDGEKILTVPAEQVALFIKYFRGYSYAPEGEIKVSWSTDLKNWQASKFWWKDNEGRQAHLACGSPDKDLYLRFSGSGMVRDLRWKAAPPISLEFDPEPYLVPGAGVPELKVNVGVLVTEKLAFNGNPDLGRRKWLRLYNKPDAVGIPEYYEAAEYFVPMGFAGSRDAGFRLTDDPDKTFSEDKKLIAKMKPLYPEGLKNVVCFDHLPAELQCRDKSVNNAKSCPEISKFTETAERVAATIAQREQVLREYAGFYCEVKNESDIGFNWGYFTNAKKYDGWKLLADYHNEVARAVKRRNPRWKVGGPSSCIPVFDNGNFERGRQMLKFVERTCNDLDYYSWHFYERTNFRLTPAMSYLYGRLDATMDLYRSHLRLHGGEKPLIITEYGGGGEANDIGIWMALRSANQLLVEMMDYPDLIEMAVPFILPVAWWTKNNPNHVDNAFLLFVYDENKKIKLSKVGNFLNLWRDLDGVRIPITSGNPDLNVMACRDGKKVYIALSNLSGHRLKVNLKAVMGDAAIKKILQRRFYIERAEIQSRTDELGSLEEVPVAFDETTVLVLELDKDPGFDGQFNRKVFCAPEIMQPTGRKTRLTITLPEDDTAPKYARLRLGLWREGSFPSGGTVTVNGRKFLIAGFTPLKSSWFGTREISLPTEILREQNTINATFPDKKGLITSAVLYGTYYSRKER